MGQTTTFICTGIALIAIILGCAIWIGIEKYRDNK